MTTAPTAVSSPSADPVVDTVIAQRTNLGYFVLVLGVVFVGLGIFLATKAFGGPKEPAKPDDTSAVDKDKEKDEEKDKDKPDLKVLNPHRGEYILAMIGAAMAGVTCLGVGTNLLVGIPKPTLETQRTDARIAILTLGGLFGLALMTTGLAFLIIYFEVLAKWVTEKTTPDDAWKVVAALFGFLCGSGIAFLAVQPARAEERNNTLIRRLIYGSNFGLTTLLLLLVLLVGNVLFGLKVPNKLDTTEGGFYTLSDATKEFLAGLNQPVKAYTTIPEDAEDRVAGDARRLLDACQEANPGKFSIKYISPALSKGELTRIRNQFPQADFSDYGILLAIGEDEKQYVFIRRDEMVDRAGGGFGADAKITFKGEGKLIQELLFLTESKSKPTIYFTTGHGEIDVAGMPGGPDAAGPKRTGNTIRTVLEKGYAEVRPLKFELTDPKVPDDATMVVIADPRSPIPADQLAALRTYLTGPKKGKLVVMSSPSPKPDGTGVVETGLDDLLSIFSVRLGKEYLLSAPLETLGYSDVQGLVGRRLTESRNPIALEFAPPRAVLFTNPREVIVAPPERGGAVAPTANALFLSYPPDRITWFESDPVPNPEKVLREMVRNADMIRAKRATQSQSRVLAALVTEGETARAAVFGSGDGFVDPERGSAKAVENNADLLFATVNWLRDRPAAANIANKTYGEYKPNKAADENRLIWLPFLLIPGGVMVLGLGVWMFRRK